MVFIAIINLKLIQKSSQNKNFENPPIVIINVGGASGTSDAGKSRQAWVLLPSREGNERQEEGAT